jgi:DNA-binding response OmpR family regulator
MHILLAEDEQQIARALKKGLSQEDYSVDIARNGIEAYEFAKSLDYDLYIIDWMMPIMSGIDFIKKVRAASDVTPILLLTAKSQTSNKVEGLTAGADDYLTKPFAFDELLARIKALLRRPKLIIADELLVSGIKLNTSSCTVTINEYSIALTAKEFALLEYLLRNKNRVVTKEQITNHVWDYNSEILPNTVEVTIKNLRKKLQAAPGDRQDVITTMRGFGYIIKE